MTAKFSQQLPPDLEVLINGIGQTPDGSLGQKGPEPLRLLRWLVWRWDGEPIPDRLWSIRDRVPLRQAGLFSGEGGGGKSTIELHKDVADKDWLGSLPEPGPVLYVGPEDDENEIHIRLAAIAAKMQPRGWLRTIGKGPVTAGPCFLPWHQRCRCCA